MEFDQTWYMLSLKIIWNPVDFQGNMSKVKVTVPSVLARGYATLCVALAYVVLVPWNGWWFLTLNNILAVSWMLALLMEETPRKPSTWRNTLIKFITYSCIEYTSPWSGFELTMLVVICTDRTGGCKHNYHTMITTTVNPQCCFKISHLLQVTRVLIYSTKSHPVYYRLVIGLYFWFISGGLF